eukprot:GHVU01025591.1.p1 GENE.GHVU01025591.1~~GHVU01025591.1.p1  ORF type:complete len:114 (-),score=2.48 GHVU01025591.1:208-549(-)
MRRQPLLILALCSFSVQALSICCSPFVALFLRVCSSPFIDDQSSSIFSRFSLCFWPRRPVLADSIRRLACHNTLLSAAIRVLLLLLPLEESWEASGASEAPARRYVCARGACR